MKKSKPEPIPVMDYRQYRRARRLVHECCNYDGGNCFAVFKNVFNDYYAKDTSKKIRAVVKMRGEAGEHIASNPPYGYVKDPQNKKKWIVDEESAKVVRRIFPRQRGESTSCLSSLCTGCLSCRGTCTASTPP